MWVFVSPFLLQTSACLRSSFLEPAASSKAGHLGGRDNRSDLAGSVRLGEGCGVTGRGRKMVGEELRVICLPGFA